MALIDVHAHLDVPQFEDLDELLARQAKAGVITIIANGTNPDSNAAVLRMAQKYSIVRAALGYHPTDLVERKFAGFEDTLKLIRSHAKSVVAIGEVGLDYHHHTSHVSETQNALQQFVQLALELNKPLIIHTRKAATDTLDILEKNKAHRVILHCFEGNTVLIRRGLALGYYFSIPPNIVRSAHFKHLVSLVPINRLFTETDSPFLAPVAGNVNEPKNVAISVEQIAKIKGLDQKECETLLYANFQRLFD